MTVAYFADGNYPSHDIKWINYLVKEHNIKAVVFLRPDSEKEHFSSKVKIYPILKSLPLLNPFARNKLIKQYQRLLTKERVELVHFMGGELKCQYGPFLGFPFLITTRGTDILEQLPKKYLQLKFSWSKSYLTYSLGKFFHKRAYRNAELVTSTSYEQMRAVLRFQPKIKRQNIIRTGCFIEKFLEKDINHTGRILRIFSPRTMKSICNQHLIIEAFSRFLENEPDAELYMVDNLPELPWSKEVRRKVKEFKLEGRVKFLPRLSQSEMKHEYLKSDLTIMIPNSDGTPVSGIECMLTGSPLIIGDYQYDPDLFNENTVWKLKETSSVRLHQQIVEIQAQLSKPSFLEKLQAAQYVAIDLADTRKEMGRLSEGYKSILGRRT